MSFEVWKFLAGLGLFLFGMHEMESVLKIITGRAFKLFLKNYTKNTFIAISIGAAFAGLVQSSSLVSFMVLAFVESGTMTFQNGLAIIFGANVGTTLTGWMIATIGFGFNIEEYAFPIIACSSIAMFFLRKKPIVFNYSRLGFSMGFLFLSISFMKQGAEVLVKHFDLTSVDQYGKLAFLIAGIIITSLVQSSSATMAIALTALFTNAIDYKSAAALVIGSELGTTIKTALWSLQGSANQKRVGWGNFIFNMFTCIFAFIFLDQILYIITNFIGIKSPPIALVTFQSIINIGSVVVFLPFLPVFSKFLGSLFGGGKNPKISYLSGTLTGHSALTMEEYYVEAKNVFHRSLAFHKELLGSENMKDSKSVLSSIREIFRERKEAEVNYGIIKRIEGELLEHFTKLSPSDYSSSEWDDIKKYLKSVREAVEAAKSVKDVLHNFNEFNESADDIIHEQTHRLHANWLKFENEIIRISKIKVKRTLYTELQKLMLVAYKDFNLMEKYLLSELKRGILDDSEVSTLINVERQLRSSKKSLIRSLAKLEIEAFKADEFEYIPDF
jgi:phosphate:Na+ symporter